MQIKKINSLIVPTRWKEHDPQEKKKSNWKYCWLKLMLIL